MDPYCPVREYVHRVGRFILSAFLHQDALTPSLLVKFVIREHEKISVSDAMKAQVAILNCVLITTPKVALISSTADVF